MPGGGNIPFYFLQNGPQTNRGGERAWCPLQITLEKNQRKSLLFANDERYVVVCTYEDKIGIC